MDSQDYYEVLDIEKHVTNEDIKKAYRNLARRFHPDKNLENPEMEEKFKAITIAYKTLSNARSRQIYDLCGHEGVEYAEELNSDREYTAIEIFIALKIRKVLSLFSSPDRSANLASCLISFPPEIEIVLWYGQNMEGEMSLKISPSVSIVDLKKRIVKELGIPINQQKLLIGGRELIVGSLADNNIFAGTTIIVEMIKKESFVNIKKALMSIFKEANMF